MPKNRLRDAEWLRALTVFVASLGLVSSCQSGGSAQNVSGGDAGQARGDVPLVSLDTNVVIYIDGGSSSAIDGTCSALTSCKIAGGQYCGVIGDGCNANLNCGDCPAGQTCAGHVCTSGSGYDGGLLTSCTVTGGQYCGDIGNGAGGKLSCGACTTAGWTCTDGLCTADATACAPNSCQTGSGQYCGTIGDG